MPLHPVPIIIGTTLAVIGSGIAFKKFVYDPHLAPYIEAFLAAHHLSLPSHSRSHAGESDRELVPISLPSSGHSTARQSAHGHQPQSHLRRRSHARKSSGGVYELEDSHSLLHSRKVSHGHSLRYADEARRESHGEGEGEGTAARRQQHFFSDDRDDTSRKSSLSLDRHPLIETMEDRPQTPQEADAEIRQVIFNYAAIPSVPQSRPATPPSPSTSPAERDNINPFLSPFDTIPRGSGASDQHAQHAQHSQLGQSGRAIMAMGPTEAPSSTFSFLSLSQASSPENPHQALQSMSFAEVAKAVDSATIEAERGHFGDIPSQSISTFRRGSGARTEDVRSLPDPDTESTSERLSEYQDAESYSPPPSLPSAGQSPFDSPVRPQVPIPPVAAAVAVDNEPSRYDYSYTTPTLASLGKMGLSYVQLGMPAAGRGVDTGGSRRERGPMSVISVTDSELGEIDDDAGERGESDCDWEAIGSGSEAGRP